MSLGQEQELFVIDVLALITKAKQLGFGVRFGEVYRTPEQQAIYVRAGRSQTMNSMHLNRTAIDLVLVRDGQIATYEQLRDLGAYWESLSPKNRWGGNWKKLVDTPHFERTV